MRSILILFAISVNVWATPVEMMDAIQNLRQVAENVSKGSVNQEIGNIAKAASTTLNVGCNGVGGAPVRGTSYAMGVLSGVPKLDVENAKVLDSPKLRCDVVRNGFHWAKHYWSELVCITKKAVWASGYPNPNLYYIQSLTRRAETLRQWIEQVFPSAWDSQDQNLEYEWLPVTGKVKNFTPVQIDWNGRTWEAANFPRHIEVSVADNKVKIKRRISISSFCLEPVTAKVDAKFQTDSDPEDTLKLSLGN